MTGEPGKAVEGGWTFTTDDQAFELAYKANEGGFQPEAAHIPGPVEDTPEVAEAKAKFLTLLEAGHAYAPVRRKRYCVFRNFRGRNVCPSDTHTAFANFETTRGIKIFILHYLSIFKKCDFSRN